MGVNGNPSDSSSYGQDGDGGGHGLLNGWTVGGGVVSEWCRR